MWSGILDYKPSELTLLSHGGSERMIYFYVDELAYLKWTVTPSRTGELQFELLKFNFNFNINIKCFYVFCIIFLCFNTTKKQHEDEYNINAPFFEIPQRNSATFFNFVICKKSNKYTSEEIKIIVLIYLIVVGCNITQETTLKWI